MARSAWRDLVPGLSRRAHDGTWYRGYPSRETRWGPAASRCRSRVARVGVWLPRILVGLASVVAILAIFAIWADRQLLNTDEWVKTSSALLRNEHVQKQSAEYLASQVS